VLVTLLFYRIGYVWYQLVLYLLVSYWVVSEWEKLQRYNILKSILVFYFGLLGIIADPVFWDDYNVIVALLKFLAGCVLLASLFQFSAYTTLRTSAKSLVRTLASSEGGSTSDGALKPGL
jgi:hypothetical protein